jgi:DNA-binding transcriptional LysR family regulator
VGREYLDGCRTIIEKLDEMESNLLETTRDPQGTLRIATPMTLRPRGWARCWPRIAPCIRAWTST